MISYLRCGRIWEIMSTQGLRLFHIFSLMLCALLSTPQCTPPPTYMIWPQIEQFVNGSTIYIFNTGPNSSFLASMTCSLLRSDPSRWEVVVVRIDSSNYLNYKTLRKERKRRNSRHRKARKTAKTSFPFLLPNSHFNSEAIRNSANIRNTATVISAMWVSTVTQP